MHLLTSGLTGPPCARVHNLQESLHPSPPLSRFSSSFYDRRGTGMHAARIPSPSSTVASITSADVMSRHNTLPLMPHLLQRQSRQEGGLQV